MFGELLRGVIIISTSARTAPSVYPDLGDCGEGGRDEMLFVCVVLSCDMLCLRRKPNTSGTAGFTDKDRPD